MTSQAAGKPANPKTVGGILEELDSMLRKGEAQELAAIPTGFQPLDQVLGNGVHPGELTLVGGSPGVGKTILTLQWARNMARDGLSAIYACYEHEESELLLRLLALEMGEMGPPEDPLVEALRARVRDAAAGLGGGLKSVLADDQIAAAAYDRVEKYKDRLFLLRASGAHTGLGELEQILADRAGSPSVLFVDYLQKVSIRPEPPEEAEKVTKIAEGLKDLALTYKVPVVCVVASDMEGLRARRLRLHHLRGSSALAFESDVIIILNEKFYSVSKVHLAYDTVGAERFKQYAVLSLEKNRGGPNLIDLEFKKDFAHYRFHQDGGVVTEKLVDERVFVE